MQALNRNLNLQSFRVLYMTGNYSAVLSKLDRRFKALEIRRGFTVFQLMTILEENHHSIIFLEHDPLLYEDAQEMTEYVSLAMGEAAKEAAVLLYAPGADPYFEELVKNADRVFYFDEGETTNLDEVQSLILSLVGAELELYYLEIICAESVINSQKYLNSMKNAHLMVLYSTV